jgi:hypothetical protein
LERYAKWLEEGGDADAKTPWFNPSFWSWR